MMKLRNIYLFLLALLVVLGSCTKDEPLILDPDPEPEPGELKEGLNYDPVSPNADKELKITFKAAKSSALYGYTGDVYIHTGIVDGDWLYVPAEWDKNIDKCKMKKESDNVWSITLSPSVRKWFGSGSTSVQKLGIVIRSSDGKKKGIETDSFVLVTDDENSFTPGEVEQATMPANMEYGINIGSDNKSVTFVLYDKDKNEKHKDYVCLIGDFNDWVLDNKYMMKRDEAAGCWWYTVSGLDAAKEYAFQYYVGSKTDGNVRLADAYSEKILDPSNDKYIPASTYPNLKAYPEGKTSGIVSVFKIQKDTYNWSVANFKAADKNDLVVYEMLFRDFTDTGDINGAMAKLDYIKSLGFNAVELMPVQEFDGNDSWGYNPCFYFALDKAYGTKEMYKKFIDACHERGMAVIFDVVYNHATGSMPFAKLYWDDKNNKTAANNPWFNVDAPHPYSVFHDFNHSSDLVKTFVKRSLKFLLEEYNIDGFRFDLTKGFTQNSSTEETASNYDASRIAILKGYNEAIKAVKPDAYVILEHFCADNEEKELAADGMMMWRNLNNAYCQSAMGYKEDSDFSRLRTATPNWVGFMESHDEERMGYKQTAYGKDELKTSVSARMKQLSANTAFFLTVPGPKMVWQFGEMGYDISIEENGRTGKKPLHWEYLDDADRKSLHDTYSKLMKLRNDNPELFDENVTFDWKVGISDWDSGRFISSSSTTKKMVIIGNFGQQSNDFGYDNLTVGNWYDYITGEELKVTETAQKISVPAHGFKVYVSFK